MSVKQGIQYNLENLPNEELIEIVNMPIIHSPDKPPETVEEVQDELDRLRSRMNFIAQNLERSITSGNVLLKRGLDRDGRIKQKINHLHVLYEGLKPKNLNKQVRPFVTDLYMQPFKAGAMFPLQFRFAQNPVWPSAAYANIWWAGESYGELITVNVQLGTPAGWATGSPIYWYIDTNAIGGYTIAGTVNLGAAATTGIVCLFIYNDIMRTNTGMWFQATWGGGMMVS